MKKKNVNLKSTKQTNPNPLKRLLEKIFQAKGRKLLKTIKWQTELLTNPLYSTAEKIVVAAGTSGGKSLALVGKCELEYLLKKMDFYYRKESKNRKKTLICPSSTNVLKDNMVDTFIKFNPSFTYKVVSDRKDLIEAVNGDYDVIIALPQLCIASVDLLPKVDLFVLDEAHTWYFAKKGMGTIHKIIDATKPTQQILLTGTPFPFQRADRKDKFTFIHVPVFDLMDEGLVSKPKVEIVSTPSYNFNNNNYNSTFGNLKGGQTKSKIKNRASIKEVLFDMVIKLYYNSDYSILKNKKNLGLVTELWNNVGKMLSEMNKTIIFCDSREQADEFGKILNGIEKLKNKILVSHSKNDTSSENFVKFQNDSNINILVAVDRGRLGYNVEELFNVVDFTFTQNLAMLLQMFGRLLRLSETQPDKRKIYYKVATAETAEYFSTLMLGMFHLFHIDWYKRFDGKNMGQIKVPQIRKPKGGKGGGGKGGKKRVGLKPTVNINDLDLLDIDVYRNVLHKNDDLFATIKWTTLDDVRRKIMDVKDCWKRDFRPFEEARKFVQKLGIKSQSEWREALKSGKIPDDIPSTPSVSYVGDYLSWEDWLGTKPGWDGKFLTYKEALNFIKPLKNVKCKREWVDYSTSKDFPYNLPSTPAGFYKSEWNGWGEFLSSGNIQPQMIELLPMKEAQKWAIKNKIKSVVHWNELCSKKKIPINIPKGGATYYGMSWPEFLQNGNDKSEFLPFKEAHKIVLLLELVTQKEWNEWAKTKRPNNIPYNPSRIYKNEWNGWGDWLGTGRVANKITKL